MVGGAVHAILRGSWSTLRLPVRLRPATANSNKPGRSAFEGQVPTSTSWANRASFFGWDVSLGQLLSLPVQNLGAVIKRNLSQTVVFLLVSLQHQPKWGTIDKKTHPCGRYQTRDGKGKGPRFALVRFGSGPSLIIKTWGGSKSRIDSEP